MGGLLKGRCLWIVENENERKMSFFSLAGWSEEDEPLGFPDVRGVGGLDRIYMSTFIYKESFGGLIS